MQTQSLDKLTNELYEGDAAVDIKSEPEKPGFFRKYFSGAKRSLKSLAYSAVIPLVLAVGAREAKATMVNSNYIIKDNIEYYMQTDKEVYDLGENVEMLYRVSNLGEEDVTFGFSDTIQHDFIVQAKRGENFNEIWRWTYFNLGLQIPTSFSLLPNEFKEFSGIWSQIDAKGTVSRIDDTPAIIGTYKILGSLTYRYEPDSMVGVDINIVPEPSMMTLFGLGGLALFALSKRKHRLYK